MRTGLLLSGVLLAFLSMGLNPKPAPATVEIGKQTKRACTVCHIKTGAKELNEAGKYFLEKKTLDGFVAKENKEVKK
jgi:hypothetical protein